MSSRRSSSDERKKERSKSGEKTITNPSKSAVLERRCRPLSENEKYMIYRDSAQPNISNMDLIKKESLRDIDRAYEIFFKHHTCYDLIPGSSKLVVFDVSLSVKKAFYALVYNGVRAAHLWDSNRQAYVGMLTITDFIRILHKFYRSSDHRVEPEELENHQIQTWRELIQDHVRPLILIGPEASLLDAIHALLSGRVHRLPIIDTPSGNPLHILTHKRLLKYLHLNLHQLPLPKFMLRKVTDLGIGTYSGICTIKSESRIIEALNLFVLKRVSALPVVDEENRMIDIYAKFDVINLAATKTFDNLNISVFDALAYRRDHFIGVSTCSPTDTLQSIVDKIVEAGVHRLVMVDGEKRVIGIVSLSDILGYFVKERTE